MLYQCALRASGSGGGTKRTVRKGKRELTVDVHCHVHVPAADAMLAEAAADQKNLYIGTNELTAEVNRNLHREILPKLTDPEVRLADMDAQGVDVQALSPAPFHYNYGFEAGLARDTARVVNDRIAELVAGHPDRFVGLCTVPLQDPGLAVAELDRAVGELGMRGVETSTHVNGTELTRAGLEPFFARVEELGVMIFIHPIGTTMNERMNDHYFTNLIGHPVESALAVGHLVFDGYLERYPGLKICIAHGGGYVPAYAGRFDHPYHLRDDCRVHLTRPPTEYLKKLYFDTVVFTDHQLRYLVDTWGADRVVMGTDYPYDMAETDPVGHVDSVKGLGRADRALIVGGNAGRLLGIDTKARTNN